MARLFRQSPCACFRSHCSGLICRSVCLSYVTCRDPPPPAAAPPRPRSPPASVAECGQVYSRTNRIVGGHDSSFGSHPWQVGVVRVAPLAGGCRSGRTPGRWVSFGSHPWQVGVVRVTPLAGGCRSGHTPGRWVSFGSHPWQVGVVRVTPLAGGCRSGRTPGR